MNRIHLLAACLFLGVAAHAQSPAEILTAASPSVVTVEAKIEIDLGEMAMMMGLEDDVIERTLTGHGVVVRADGLVAVPTSAIEMPLRRGGRMRLEPERTALTVSFHAEHRLPMQVVGVSKKLGLSFLQPLKKSNVKWRPVAVHYDSALLAGEDIVAVGRTPLELGRTAFVVRGQCGAPLQRPFACALALGLDAGGLAVYTAKGTFVGVSITAPRAEEDPASRFLPGGRRAPSILVVGGPLLREEIPGGAGDAPAETPSNVRMTKAEFLEYARRLLGVEDDEKTLLRFVDAVDANGDGSVSEKEFAARMDVLDRILDEPREKDDDDSDREPPGEREPDDVEADFERA